MRIARADELGELEALQLRASLANAGAREAVLAHPEWIAIPQEQVIDQRVFVAERDGGMVGFCTELDRSDGETELDGLFVEPTFWRGGVGRVLVERARQYGRERGAAWLHVVGNEHAEGFYLACGFERCGVEQTEFGVGLLMRVDVRLGRP